MWSPGGSVRFVTHTPRRPASRGARRSAWQLRGQGPLRHAGRDQGVQLPAQSQDLLRRAGAHQLVRWPARAALQVVLLVQVGQVPGPGVQVLGPSRRRVPRQQGQGARVKCLDGLRVAQKVEALGEEQARAEPTAPARTAFPG